MSPALRVVDCTTTLASWLVDSTRSAWLVDCTAPFSCRHVDGATPRAPWLINRAATFSQRLIDRASTLSARLIDGAASVFGLVDCAAVLTMRLVDCASPSLGLVDRATSHSPRLVDRATSGSSRFVHCAGHGRSSFFGLLLQQRLYSLYKPPNTDGSFLHMTLDYITKESHTFAPASMSAALEAPPRGRLWSPAGKERGGDGNGPLGHKRLQRAVGGRACFRWDGSPRRAVVFSRGHAIALP